MTQTKKEFKAQEAKLRKDMEKTQKNAGLQVHDEAEQKFHQEYTKIH
tara:strand:- start:270 stop:410 length:141 start_codon:yes stop_codon:yes gene_type:complete